MPLYSNTATGSNQVTYTPSEQVTKILPHDSVFIQSTNWSSFKELSIPLGPHQRVIGTMECWYDSNTDDELYIRAKLSDPSDAHILPTSSDNRKSGDILFNSSSATKIKNVSEVLESGGDSGADHVILNATIVDTDTTGSPPELKLQTNNSDNRYFTISFRAVSADNTHSELRFQFACDSDDKDATHLKHGTRITYTKY